MSNTVLGPLGAKAAAAIRLSREPNARVVGYEGAIRSGKSVSSWLLLLEAISEAKGGAVLIVGKNLLTLQRNVVEPLQALLGTTLVKPLYGINVVWIIGVKCFLISGSDAASEQKIRGNTAALVYIDEATLLSENLFTQLQGRLSAPNARMIFTTNPDAPSHYLKKFLDDAEVIIEQNGTVTRNNNGSGIYRYRFTLDDNEYLPPTYISDLRRRYGTTTLFARRMLNGEWCQGIGAIYSMLSYEEGSQNLWVEAPDPSQFREVVLGVDWGMTNTTAMVAVGLYQGKAYVLSEKRLNGSRSVAQQAEALNAWVHAGCPDATGVNRLPVIPAGSRIPYKIVMDPSAAALRVQWHELTGQWPWEDKGGERVNAVLKGISLVAALFDTSRLLLNRSATPALCEELDGYVWDEKILEGDKPVKRADHSADALRYSVVTLKRSMT